MKSRVTMFILAAALLALLPGAAALATGGHGGGHGCHHGGGGHHGCNNPCGAEIEVLYCFDQEANGSCGDPLDHPIEQSSPEYSVRLYNEGWQIMAIAIPGRDDGDAENEEDGGLNTFQGMKPGTYIVCAGGRTDRFKYPVSNSTDPSNRVHIVENLSGAIGESEYCFEVDLRRNCGEEVTFAWNDYDD